MRILLASGLFFFLFHPCFGEDNIRYYDIEVAVFESLEEASDSNELWPAGKQLQIPENAAILGRKYEGQLPPEYNTALLFKDLPVEDYHLTSEVESIKESEHYRLLLHTGWRQPGLPHKKAVTVYFKHAVSESLTVEASTDDAATNSSPTSPVTTVNPESGPLPDSSGPIANLEGMITIALSRYLHLDVEMLYKKQTNNEAVDMFDSAFLEDRRGKESVFYLHQNRRMRSKETHYIDHPKFSMLVRITPYVEVVKTPPAKSPG